MWSASLSGAKAVPGTYQVRLSVNNFKSQNTFQIMRSPTSESSVDQMREQFTFVNQINKTIFYIQVLERIHRNKITILIYSSKHLLQRASYLSISPITT